MWNLTKTSVSSCEHWCTVRAFRRTLRHERASCYGMRTIGRGKRLPNLQVCLDRRWICGLVVSRLRVSRGFQAGNEVLARDQMSPRIRARILALTRTSPPAETGLSHWSSREMADYVRRTENTYVSHHYVAKLWRDNGLKPHRQGTFKVSRDPAFAREGRRHRRAVPRPTRRCRGPLDRRENADPGLSGVNFGPSSTRASELSLRPRVRPRTSYLQCLRCGA